MSCDTDARLIDRLVDTKNLRIIIDDMHGGTASVPAAADVMFHGERTALQVGELEIGKFRNKIEPHHLQRRGTVISIFCWMKLPSLRASHLRHEEIGGMIPTSLGAVVKFRSCCLVQPRHLLLHESCSFVKENSLMV